MAFSGMPQKVTYGCTALVGSNKAGKLRPDGDGYYTVVIGALNAFNSSGAFYPLAPAKSLFDASSSLMRRIANGNCKGEMGHPKPLPGQSTRDYVQRIMIIEETRVCCHFRKVWLQDEGVKDADGRPIVAILAEVKPSGPMGPALKESLDNPHENVCFSIRSLTMDRMSPAGFLQKDLKQIITWDVVTEPGLSGSTKYNSPALESFVEGVFTPAHLDALEEVRLKGGVAVENALVDLKALRNDLGWGKSQLSSLSKPPSSRW